MAGSGDAAVSALAKLTRRDVAAYRVVHAERRWYLVAHDIRLEIPHGQAVRMVAPTVGQVTAETDDTTLLRIGADDLD